jgi:CBS domain-containing protein/predicted kinase
VRALDRTTREGTPVGREGAPVRLDMDAINAFVLPASTGRAEEREHLYRALVATAVVLVQHGTPVIIDAVGQRREWRDLARASIPDFAEIETRRPATPGDTADSWEPPLTPDAVVDITVESAEAAVERTLPVATALARTAPPPRGRGMQAGWAIWISGPSGSGKTTLTEAVAEALGARQLDVAVIEDETLSETIVGAGEPSDAADDLVNRTLVLAVLLMAGAGSRVLIDATGARRQWRVLARARIPHFGEVELACPSHVCARRERVPRRNTSVCAELGGTPRLTTQTGIPYQAADKPDLRIDTNVVDEATGTQAIMGLALALERAAAATLTPAAKETRMQVRDLMTRTLITVGPDTSVTEARSLMARERIRHLLITENNRLVGIVTDRDIRLNLASPATSLSVWELNFLLARLTVGQVMTKSLIVVEPDRDSRDAARIMLDHKIGALPVLEGERLVGILTETDLVRAFADAAEPVSARRS